VSRIVSEFKVTREELPNVDDVAVAVLILAEAVRDLTQEVKNLGLADADTRMGALELLAKEIHDGLKQLAER